MKVSADYTENEVTGDHMTVQLKSGKVYRLSEENGKLHILINQGKIVVLPLVANAVYI